MPMQTGGLRGNGSVEACLHGAVDESHISGTGGVLLGRRESVFGVFMDGGEPSIWE